MGNRIVDIWSTLSSVVVESDAMRTCDRHFNGHLNTQGMEGYNPNVANGISVDGQTGQHVYGGRRDNFCAVQIHHSIKLSTSYSFVNRSALYNVRDSVPCHQCVLDTVGPCLLLPLCPTVIHSLWPVFTPGTLHTHGPTLMLSCRFERGEISLRHLKSWDAVTERFPSRRSQHLGS